MSVKKLQRIILVVYIGMMLAFSVIVYLFYNYIQDSTSMNVIENQEELTNQISGQIDSFIGDMDNIALQIMENEVLLEGFGQTDDDYETNWFDRQILLKNRMQNAMMKINGPKDRAERICVYNEKQDYVSYGVVYERESEVSRNLAETDVPALMETISNTPYSKRMISVHRDLWGAENDIISVFRVLQDSASGKKYGIIEVQRPTEKLEQNIIPDNEGNMEILVLDSENRVILSALKENKAEDIIDMCSQEPGKTETDSDIVTWSDGNEYGWKVITVQSRENLLSPMRGFRNFIVIAIIIFSGISIAFFALIIRKILRPVRELADSVNKVNFGNLELKIENVKGSEVDRMNQAFQTMFDRLKTSMDNEIRSSLWAMQAQMNPHFLYNTLAVISAAGIEDDSEKVPLLCEKLSSMLRYSSTYDQRLSKCTSELNYVEDYLVLMRERYGGKLIFNIERSGALEEVEIPRISIQPFVENSIKHGFENKEFPWVIKIKAKKNETGWEIMIEDNGCGMSEKQIADLEREVKSAEKNLSEIQAKKIGGMGMVNTFLRFRMICRENVTFEINASENGGTRIVIRGEEND